MDYAKAVARARALHADSEANQWELAELTHRFTTGPEAETLTKWAADCGFSQPHATNLRKVWVMFGLHKGPNNRDGMTFNECYSLAMAPEGEREGLKARAKREGRRVSTVRDRNRRDGREAAREALLDDDMRREILKDPRIRAMFKRELARGRRRQTPPHRVARDVEGELVARLEAFHRQLLFLLRDMLDDPPTEEERREILRLVAEIKAALDWIRSFARNGDRSFEDALEALLEDAAQVEQTPPARARKPGPGETAEEEPAATDPTEERPRREASHQPPTGTRRTRPRRRKAG